MDFLVVALPTPTCRRGDTLSGGKEVGAVVSEITSVSGLGYKGSFGCLIF